MISRINRLKVAIVIPVFNRRETTLQGLRSLSRIDRALLDVRVFVVDDDSPDGTAKAIKDEFPEIGVIDGTGDLHYAAGTNRGIEESLKWEPDFVATMNDDAVFHPHFLNALIKTASENPGTIVGSLLLLWDEPHRVFQVAPSWKTASGGWVFSESMTIHNIDNAPFEVEALVGNCVLIPRPAIDKCGLMDEKRFPCGWGDAQWFARMKKAGWKLMVDPNSKVWCEPNTNPTALHKLAIAGQFRSLLFDYRHPNNLRRQFTARWHSAPTRPKAAAAFAAYIAQMGIRGLRYRLSEPKLHL